VNTKQHYRSILKVTNNPNMNVLNIHVSNVNIRQHDRTSLRLTNNLNMKVLNIPVPNVNIRPVETFPHSLHITQSRLCFDNKLSSEVILKVTFALNSVSTSFTLIENEFLASCENPRCFSRFQYLLSRLHILHIEKY